MFAGALYPSPEFLENPYPFYHWLRDEAPVYEVPGRGEYLVSRHADVRAILADPLRYSSAFPRQPEKLGRVPDVLESDPPDHASRRRLAMTGLKPGRVRGHRDAVATVVRSLLAGIADKQELAFMGSFAAKLPVHVFAAIFGLDPEELWHIHSMSTYVGPARRYLPEDQRTDDIERAFAMYDYLGHEIEARIGRPRDDLISEMIERQVARDGEVDLARLKSEMDILFIGGLTTTPHLLVNALYLLLRHPGTMARLRADPDLVSCVLDETLRLESPVQWQPRIVTSDVVLHGVRLPAGTRVLVVLGAANRDDRVFDDADRFDVDRPNLNENLGFGYASHFCVGASLARLEASVALHGLLGTFGDIRLSDRNDYAPYPGLSARSFRELHLLVGRRDRAVIDKIDVST